MSDLASVSIDRTNGAVVARLEGEVDLSNADDVKQQVAKEIGVPGTTLVVDLSTVSYLDSAGIRMLFKLNETIVEGGGRLRLVMPDEGIVQRVLDLTGVQSHISIFPSTAAAISAS